MRHLVGDMLIAIWIVASCGNPGDPEATKGGLNGPFKDLTGSITGQFGGQSDMHAWNLIWLDRESGAARVAQVESSGIFTLKHVLTDRAGTMLLASPDLVFSSVLSMGGAKDATVRQYFRPKDDALPRLIHRGKIIAFQSTSGVEPISDWAYDNDKDGVPEGLDAAATSLMLNADLDFDGIPTVNDRDVDNDGLPNAFDPDDDNDKINDLFDQDSNGDLKIDLSEKSSDPYFTEGLEWLAVEVDVRHVSDKESKNTLRITARVRDDVTPLSVQVRGPESLMRGALADVRDSQGNASSQAWDFRLMDDGQSEDAAEGDRIFSRKISMPQLPRSNHLVFVQLLFPENWALEFPFTFADIRPTAVNSAYDAFRRLVQLLNNPLGDQVTEFSWAVSVHDNQDRLVYTSEPILANLERSHTLPAQIFEPGIPYTYTVVAQSLDLVPGYAAYRVHGVKVAIPVK